jgi:hypothetical protein
MEEKKPWESYESDDPAAMAEKQRTARIKSAIKGRTFPKPGVGKAPAAPKLTDMLTDKEAKRRKLGAALGKFSEATQKAVGVK